jgi:flavin-dependent dehydrogenase
MMDVVDTAIDVLVIGAGPAGLAVAIAAGEAHLSC